MTLIATEETTVRRIEVEDEDGTPIGRVEFWTDHVEGVGDVPQYEVCLYREVIRETGCAESGPRCSVDYVLEHVGQGLGPVPNEDAVALVEMALTYDEEDR